jgi:hypothetical protein
MVTTDHNMDPNQENSKTWFDFIVTLDVTCS